MAIEAGTSLAVRPVAGVLADRADRQLVAAVGAEHWATREDLVAMVQLGVIQPPGRPPA